MKVKFYDTSAILEKNIYYPEEEKYVISVITLQEIENLKISQNANEEIKYKVRKFLRTLDENPNWFEIFCDYDDKAKTNDEKILSAVQKYYSLYDITNFQFITNDLSMKYLAKNKYNLNIEILCETPSFDLYTGYKDIIMNEEAMSYFYSNLNENIYELLINEYINIYDEEGKCVDSLVWTGENHIPVKFLECNNSLFGKIKPKDVYQKLALDSFKNNTITYISGPPGSGKTMLALSFLFQELEKGHIDRIVVFCNPVPARNTAKLGLRI